MVSVVGVMSYWGNPLDPGTSEISASPSDLVSRWVGKSMRRSGSTWAGRGWSGSTVSDFGNRSAGRASEFTGDEDQ